MVIHSLAGVAQSAQSFDRRRFRWRGAMGVIVMVPALLVSLFSQPLVVAASWLHLAATGDLLTPSSQLPAFSS